MAIYAKKSFIKLFKKNYIRVKSQEEYDTNKEQLFKYSYYEPSLRDEYMNKCDMDANTKQAYKFACEDLEDEAKQAMEAVVHNFNTLHCLPYHEKIWVYDTFNNLLDVREIGQIADNFESNRYKVISLNTKTGKAELKYITAIEQKDVRRRLITLTSSNGKKVTTTDNHKIMLLNADGSISEDYPEKMTHVLTPRKFMMDVKTFIDASSYDGATNMRSYVYDVDENFATFMAYYLAYGYTTEKSIGFTVTDEATREVLKTLMYSIFVVTSRLSSEINTDTGVADLLFPVGQKAVGMINEKAGNLATNKRIPDEILFATNKNIRITFLNTYLAEIGKYYTNMVTVMTSSATLQKQLQMLATTFDETILVYTNETDTQYECIFPVNVLNRIGISNNLGNDMYELSYYDYSFLNHNHNIDDKDTIITKDIADKMASEDDNFKVISNLYPITVKNITDSNSGDEYVYDLSVEDNETFLTADMIFVHNSRAGAQVPFSSINFGTDITQEGRLVTREFLLAQERGLGHGETPIFPKYFGAA